MKKSTSLIIDMIIEANTIDISKVKKEFPKIASDIVTKAKRLIKSAEKGESVVIIDTGDGKFETDLVKIKEKPWKDFDDLGILTVVK